ncbi:MAG: S-methyl-5-thioribose kinase [Tissierellia bacterium]|jgi:5-methylthioribose kinase|nr:S-methyl-5-thioribose kinase [Tissierellia bacterium]
MEKNTSKLMTKREMIDYITNNFDFFENSESLICEEIGDGNINYVFRIRDTKTNKSLVVKQSDVLLRSSGRPLDIYRSKIEAEVLKIENKLILGYVPQVYFYDEEKALIIMEDISNYKNLRLELLNGNFYSHLSDYLGEFLGKTLIPMTDLVISRKEKKENAKKFTNPELCDITEDLVLTEPYFNYKNRNIITPGLEDYVRNNLYKNEQLHGEVLKLKDKYQNYSQTLLHGDLHLGSIFVNDNGIKVIDPEFAFYGPAGYDIGNVWGNLFFPLGYYTVVNNNKEYISQLKSLIVDTIDKTISALDQSFDENVENDFLKNKKFKTYYLKEIISDSFGYGGTEIIRRVVGDAKVAEVTSVKELSQRQSLDKLLIEIGTKLIINRDKYSQGKDVIEEFERIIEKI